MARTNIEIDEVLLAEAMRRFDLSTKREAVDFALRRLVGPVMSRPQMLAMEGSGWDGDPDALRGEAVAPL